MLNLIVFIPDHCLSIYVRTDVKFFSTAWKDDTCMFMPQTLNR